MRCVQQSCFVLNRKRRQQFNESTRFYRMMHVICHVKMRHFHRSHLQERQDSVFFMGPENKRGFTNVII